MCTLKMKNFKVYLLILETLLFLQDSRGAVKFVETGEHAYQASLIKVEDQRHICSGSVIGEKQVLSLATCVLNNFQQQYLPSMVNVIVGNIKTNSTIATLQRQVVKIVVHQKYRKEDGSNNIAIIKLDHEITFDDNREFIAPTTNYLAHGRCFVTGWGLQHPDQVPFNDLSVEEVTIIDTESCRNIYKAEDIQLAPDTLCAISNETEQSECTSDRGSPLVCEGLLIGLSNPRVNCTDQRNLPSVYTSIHEHTTWIEQITQEKNVTKTTTTPGAASTFNMKVLSVVNFAFIYYINKFVL